MKKSDRKYVIFIVILSLFAITVKLLEPKEIDWSEGYSYTEKKPFGAFILYDLATEHFNEGSVTRINAPIFELEKDSSTASRNWIFLNSSFSPDQFETRILQNHAQKGDFIFVSAWGLDGAFIDTLGFKVNKTLPFINPNARSLDSLTQSSLNFTNPDLRSKDGWDFPIRLTENYISEFDTSRTTVLGTNGAGQANFIKIKEGNGAFYIHTNPFLFGNYFVKDTAKYDYAFKAFSYLPNQDTFWDEYYKEGRLAFNSPMRYIVSNNSLKWAWFLALAALVLYVIFKGRRTQRIIPEIHGATNTSIDFAQTIGSLYLNTGTHKNLLDKKFQFLLDYIRTRLNVETHTLDDEALTKIALRSGIPKKEIEELFNVIQSELSKDKLTDTELKRITERIDRFYKQSQR